ncbi:uncharacterized protein LOC129221129 [Uloborus diversus]|uniref:uncharacterized protein LOC129221129 n=1 Tax=Uloborus diversus TaxID=327109 RepID=UPI00240A8736|nr:uncharacterized protein LOC129221129 [Uloborus diversus]
MVLLLMFYASAIVTSYFRLLYQFHVMLSENFGIEAVAPYGSCWGRRFYVMFRRRPRYVGGGPAGGPTAMLSSHTPPAVSSRETGSTTPLDANEMKDRLAYAYAKLKKASEEDHAMDIERYPGLFSSEKQPFPPTATQTVYPEQVAIPPIPVPSPDPSSKRYLAPESSPKTLTYDFKFEKRNTIPISKDESAESKTPKNKVSSSQNRLEPQISFEARKRALSVPDPPRLKIFEEQKLEDGTDTSRRSREKEREDNESSSSQNGENEPRRLTDDDGENAERLVKEQERPPILKKPKQSGREQK